MKTLQHAKQLQDRTKRFAIRVIKAFATLPKNEATRVIGRNFSIRHLPRRELSSGMSRWFELLIESELINSNIVQPLFSECEELLKISSASLATAKRNR